MNSSVNCAWQNVVVPNTTLCRRLRYNPTSSDTWRVRHFRERPSPVRRPNEGVDHPADRARPVPTAIRFGVAYRLRASVVQTACMPRAFTLHDGVQRSILRACSGCGAAW